MSNIARTSQTDGDDDDDKTVRSGSSGGRSSKPPPPGRSSSKPHPNPSVIPSKKILSTAQKRWLGAVDDIEQPTLSSKYSLSSSSPGSPDIPGSPASSPAVAMLARAKRQIRHQEEQHEASANTSISSGSIGSVGGRSRRQRTGSMGLGSFQPEQPEKPKKKKSIQRRPRGSMDMRPQRRSMDMRPQRRSMDMRPHGSETPPRAKTPPRGSHRSSSMDMRPPRRSTDMRQQRASMDMRPRTGLGEDHGNAPPHRSRSMDMRGGAGRYSRNRSIDHVSPGIHRQGNRLYENDGTFRLDAREGITLNLRRRSSVSNGASNGASNSASNHYTMQTMVHRKRGSTILEESEESLSESNLDSHEKRERSVITEEGTVDLEDEASSTPSNSMGDFGGNRQFENDNTTDLRTSSNFKQPSRQASTGDFSLHDNREFPIPHVKASRRFSGASMLSELSLGELDVKKEDASKHISRMSLITPEEIANSAPNHPHPGLEYPPLYFFIHRSPFLMGLFKSFIRIRWRVSYPLQRRIPLSRLLRKANIFCTFGELLLILPFFVTLISCTVYSFVYPSVSISGHTARTPLIFAFATAMHNSLLTLLLGLPFERAVFYHKLSARLSFVCGIMHTIVSFMHPDTDMDIQSQPMENSQRELMESSTIYSFMGSEPNFGKFMFANSINVGGTGIMVFMTLMIITALPYIRRKVFELFYFVHLFCVIAMLGCAFYHTGYLVPLLGSLTWGLDFLIRKIYMALFRYPRKASVRIISESVVEICFPKTPTFHYNPGQYILLAIPEISFFEWHPFSISSSPEQKIVTMHIRKAGSWTHALYDLADTQNEISILLEGPYGSVGVDVTSDRYKMVMLFSGGIGVTPMQALCNQIMYEHSSGLRTMKKLSFIWIERDPIVLQKVDVVRRETINKSTFSMSMHDDYSDDDDDDDEDDESKIHDLEASSRPGVGVVFSPNDRPSEYTGHRSILRDNEEQPDEPQRHPTLIGPQGIASTLLSLVPASGISDEALEKTYPMDELDDGEDEEDIDLFNAEDNTIVSFLHSLMPGGTQPGGSTHDDRGILDNQDFIYDVEEKDNNAVDVVDEFDNNTMCQSFLDDAYNDFDDFDDDAPENALDLQVYLTARKEVDPATENLPFVHRGRPDIKEIFRKMRDEAIDRNEVRVAVCVCAPKIIVNMCHKACIKYSDRRVCFDFHFEVFD